MRTRTSSVTGASMRTAGRRGTISTVGLRIGCSGGAGDVAPHQGTLGRGISFGADSARSPVDPGGGAWIMHPVVPPVCPVALIGGRSDAQGGRGAAGGRGPGGGRDRRDPVRRVRLGPAGDLRVVLPRRDGGLPAAAGLFGPVRGLPAVPGPVRPERGRRRVPVLP